MLNTYNHIHTSLSVSIFSLIFIQFTSYPNPTCFLENNHFSQDSHTHTHTNTQLSRLNTHTKHTHQTHTHTHTPNTHTHTHCEKVKSLPLLTLFPCTCGRV